MHAVIRTGGKQYLVQEGDVLKVEKLDVVAGSSLDLEVLFIGDEKGVKVGAPLVSGAKVSAKIIEHGRAPKVRIVKYKPKSRYRKVAGHRQPFTKLEIASIK